MNKVKTIVTITLIAVIGIVCFVLGGCQSDEVKADVKPVKEVTAEIEKAVGEVNTEKAEKEDKKDKKEEKKTEEKDAEKSNTADSSESYSSNEYSNSSNSGNSGSSSSSSSGNSNSGGNSGSSSSSSSGNSGSSEKASKPAHTHDWVAVYDTRQVEKTREEAYSRCSVCYQDCTGNEAGHGEQHLLAGEGGGYSVVYREVPYYELEEYVSGYSCNCGATK